MTWNEFCSKLTWKLNRIAACFKRVPKTCISSANRYLWVLEQLIVQFVLIWQFLKCCIYANKRSKMHPNCHLWLWPWAFFWGANFCSITSDPHYSSPSFFYSRVVSFYNYWLFSDLRLVWTTEIANCKLKLKNAPTKVMRLYFLGSRELFKLISCTSLHWPHSSIT